MPFIVPHHSAVEAKLPQNQQRKRQSGQKSHPGHRTSKCGEGFKPKHDCQTKRRQKHKEISPQLQLPLGCTAKAQQMM